jgi:hypothetical protein
MKIKIFLTLALALLLSDAMQAQDRIVTTSGDTIDCQIKSVSGKRIHYQIVNGNLKRIGKFIPADEVSSYEQNCKGNAERNDKYGKKHWRIGTQAGYTRLFFSDTDGITEMTISGFSENQARDYYKKLKNSFSFSGEIHYLSNEYLNLGVKYKFYRSSANIDEYMILGGENWYPDSEIGRYLYEVDDFYCQEKIYLNYVGPSIIYQQWLDKKHRFMLSGQLSAGALFLRNEVMQTLRNWGYVNSHLVTGNSFAANLNLAFEYYPLQSLSIAFDAGFTYSRLRSVKASMYDASTNSIVSYSTSLSDNSLNLSHLDLSSGLRYYF